MIRASTKGRMLSKRLAKLCLFVDICTDSVSKATLSKAQVMALSHTYEGCFIDTPFFMIKF
jgi:hypothetical protein